MWIFTAFGKLKGCAPKLRPVLCLTADRISAVMCRDAVEEPSPAGLCCCSGPSGLVPGCLAASPQLLGGSRVCAMGTTGLTSVCGVKVYKQVMNSRFWLFNLISFPRNGWESHPSNPVLALWTGCTVLTETYCPSSDKITISELKIIPLTCIVFRFPPFHALFVYISVHTPLLPCDKDCTEEFENLLSEKEKVEMKLAFQKSEGFLWKLPCYFEIVHSSQPASNTLLWTNHFNSYFLHRIELLLSRICKPLWRTLLQKKKLEKCKVLLLPYV